jgi:hypothetical protein
LDPAVSGRCFPLQLQIVMPGFDAKLIPFN